MKSVRNSSEPAEEFRFQHQFQFDLQIAEPQVELAEAAFDLAEATLHLGEATLRVPTLLDEAQHDAGQVSEGIAIATVLLPHFEHEIEHACERDAALSRDA